METSQMLRSIRSIQNEMEQLPINFALQNELILSKILEFLPLKDLKTTRQVDHFWNRESRKYFKLRALVKIDFFKILWNKLGPLFNEILETIKCAGNFEITEDTTNYRQVHKTFQEKIVYLIISTNIQSLTLDITQRKFQSADFQYLANVFRSLSQLKELNLRLHILDDFPDVDDWMGDLAVLEKPLPLKKFGLMLRSSDPNNPKLKQLIKKFLQLTTNIKALELDLTTSEASLYLEELNELKLEWENDKSMGPMPFKNLDSFKLHMNQIEQLLHFSQPIRKLTLLGSSDLHVSTEQLHELLKKNAKHLESFRLDSFVDLYFVDEIDMPTFPRLTSFEFNISKDTSYTAGFNFLELFKMGGEKFKDKFPSLQSFTWRNPKEEFNPVIYKMVLPNEDTELDLCFPQFTSVNLSKPPTDERKIYMYNNWMVWLAKMFPNVHNSQFNEARSFSRKWEMRMGRSQRVYIPPLRMQ